MRNVIVNYYQNIIFVIGFLGTFGSLYFSEVAGLEPCLFCWYQRIFLYPLFILTAVAIATGEKLAPKFILALAVPGALLAFYQYGMQKFSWSKGFVSCAAENPCNVVDFELLGFITIPFLSLLAFLLIIIISVIRIKYEKK